MLGAAGTAPPLPPPTSVWYVQGKTRAAASAAPWQMLLRLALRATPLAASATCNPHDPASATHATVWSGVRSAPATGDALVVRRPACGARPPRARPTLCIEGQVTNRQRPARGGDGRHSSGGSSPVARSLPPPRRDDTFLGHHRSQTQRGGDAPRPAPPPTRGPAAVPFVGRNGHGVEHGCRPRPSTPPSPPQGPLPSEHSERMTAGAARQALLVSAPACRINPPPPPPPPRPHHALLTQGRVAVGRARRLASAGGAGAPRRRRADGRAAGGLARGRARGRGRVGG